MKTKETQKKFKFKRRSCALCKPHKMRWSDKRTMADRKQAESAADQLKETDH